jgi:hypothetical protein
LASETGSGKIYELESNDYAADIAEEVAEELDSTYQDKGKNGFAVDGYTRLNLFPRRHFSRHENLLIPETEKASDMIESYLEEDQNGL